MWATSITNPPVGGSGRGRSPKVKVVVVKIICSGSVLMVARFMGFSVGREDGAGYVGHSLTRLFPDGLPARWRHTGCRAGAVVGALCVLTAVGPGPSQTLAEARALLDSERALEAAGAFEQARCQWASAIPAKNPLRPRLLISRSAGLF
ncbi:MAG: hypothetical protein N2111_00015 [Candidatus Sumerlaeaceae bacterium]|nr:hypothetical protein [Candidatus Sumerlaeaceae bacterium]